MPYIIALLVLLPFVVFALDTEAFLKQPYILLPLLAPLALLLWSFFGTWYKVVDGKLRYRSGFLTGEINISHIRQLIVGETMWAGIKPAIASKGIIIKYNRYDEIYIAPENNSEFAEDLKALNPTIEIIYKQ
ncbi:PH domain-containing protein [Pontibacter sp. Tf4]|uniref:PH domain-containing protein n=1 Tax=Pontibacter sp. Tf4 TaxID=2761620 RepID=UPI002106D552|nr:PH domain-containing protein [Pontibacter sp. Tf4]